MTHLERNCLGSDTHVSHEPGPSLGAYLRRRYRRDHRVKRLADDLGCTPKAAENILNGHWPNARLFRAIVRRFGQDVLDALFGSDVDRARLEAEVRELEEELERKRVGLRQAAGAGARLQGRMAAAEERPFR